MKTKKQAIAYARNLVTLQPVSNKVWRVDTYYVDQKVWRQGIPTDWWQARSRYAQALIDRARQFLGKDLTMIRGGGRWTDYI